MNDAATPLTDALSDRYAIDRELGRGGMATVYLARDLKHERQVAVKVLHAELAATVGAERFLREIRIAAQLNHPNILTLIDSGEVEGFLYYVMPFVEGESLREKLARERELPIQEAVRILRDVVDALASAHSKGVIHRDVKPDNVMLSGRHALVTDFGVAKALRGASGSSDVTTAGVALGTPAYMSPEQAVADEQVDHRSDIYGVGALAYELLTGRPPFLGTTPQMILAAHMVDTPDPVTKYRETVPAALEQLVMRCLEKKAADRWQSAEELLAQLEVMVTSSGGLTPTETRPKTAWKRAGGVWGRPKTVMYAAAALLVVTATAVVALLGREHTAGLSENLVLVLPFRNETGDTTYENVGHLAANLIIDRLDRAGVARIVPYGAFSHVWEAALERWNNDPNHDPLAAVVGEFGAGTIVSGLLLPQGGSIRLVAEISKDGGAERVVSIDPAIIGPGDEDVMEGLEAVSERVTAAIARHLDPSWSGSSFSTAPAPSMDVYDEYVRALEGFTGDLESNRRHAERALALDPTFTPAMHLLAVIHRNQGNYPVAESLLVAAKDLRDQMAPLERLRFEVWWAYLDGEREAAHRMLRDGVQRMQDPLLVLELGMAARARNRPQEAWEALSELDPASAIWIRTGLWRRLGSEIGSALHMLGDHRRELREIRKLREQHPDWAGFIIAEIRARATLGHVREVNALVEEAVREEALPVGAYFSAAVELRAHGHLEAAQDVAERCLAFLQERPPQVAQTASHRWDLVSCLRASGRWDEAYPVAQELVSEQPANLGYLAFLGALAARTGRTAEARDIAARIAAMEIPYDEGQSTFARASIAAVLGDKEDAVALLKQAYDEGWQHGITTHIDLDLEPLHGYPPFEEFLRPKG